MLINFRQGIINAQVGNNFIQLVNGSVNINVDIELVDLAFAYGSHDYLFTEAQQVLGAWSGLPTNQTVYLYWDIDLLSGVRTFGYTSLAPTYGSVTPISPAINQHFFNYSTYKMYVWSGSNWAEKLRLFAGQVQNNTILVPNSLGSQVSINSQTNLGYILYNSQNKPLRVLDGQGIYYFMTTEDEVHTQQDLNNAYKIDALLLDGKAIEPIPAYYAITWKGPKELGVASYVDYQYPCIGISVEASGKNEVKQFLTKGFVTNYNTWNFTAAPNTPVFVGITGEVTTTVPQKYSLQRIGHVVSPNTIFFDIQEIVLIETIATVPSPTPTVTPTITVTPSVTQTASMTVTPTITVSAQVTSTPQATVTLTPTVTTTTTPTPTASPTPSVTQTISVTTSIPASPTPSPTLTLTPSVTPTHNGGGTGGAVSTTQVSPQGSSGLTQIIFGNADDNNITIGNIPFDFYFNGVNYGNGQNGGVFIGSNGYITFGAGSDVYTGIGVSNPPYPKILLQGADDSYQKVFAGSQDAGNTYLTRYEGAGSSSGTYGSPTLIWEVKFYRNQKIQIVMGAVDRVGACGIANSTAYIDDMAGASYVANTSYSASDTNGDYGTGLRWTAGTGSVTYGYVIPPVPSPTPTPTMSVTPT